MSRQSGFFRHERSQPYTMGKINFHSERLCSQRRITMSMLSLKSFSHNGSKQSKASMCFYITDFS